MKAPDELIGGRYRLQTLLGSGGMSTVWAAWDERLQRRVAVKFLRVPVEGGSDEAELAGQRAMREARIAARLHHPYAVAVFDVVEHEGYPCLVLQFVPSITLSTLLSTDGPLQVKEAAQVGAQVGSALAAAHAVGIVHRDVKPGNILIGEDGTALISDFGIAHALGDATLTAAGLVHGTPAFLAPEVARGGEATFASDVFSLGSTLYAAVEGGPPFGTDTNSLALLHRVAAAEFAPPVQSGPLTPLVMQMLNADPDQRPSMSQAAHRLAELTQAEPAPVAAVWVAAPSPGPSTGAPLSLSKGSGGTEAPPLVRAEPVEALSAKPATEERSRRGWAVAVATMAVLVGLAVLVGVLVWPDQPPGPTAANGPSTPTDTAAAPTTTPSVEASARTVAPSLTTVTPRASASHSPTPMRPRRSPPEPTRTPDPERTGVVSQPTAGQLVRAIRSY